MNKLMKLQESDPYEIEEPSDEERASSRSETFHTASFKNRLALAPLG